MSKPPALSVITLTKNRAEFLRENLRSLLGQTKPGDEIIIVDNGSTDETPSVIRQFTHSLPIRAFRTGKSGFPALYNFAIAKTRNPVIVFYDDDCIASPGFLTGHRNAHRGDAPRIVQGQTYSVPKGNIYADIMGDHYQNWLTVHLTGPDRLKTFDNKNASMPTSLLAKYGNFSQRQSNGAEDIELGLRMARHGVPIIFDRSIICYHHERDTLMGFVRQHLRFAKADAVLSHDIPDERTLAMFVRQKIVLHAESAVRRERMYLQSGRVDLVLYLPILYLLLFIVRLWGYATAR